MLCNKCLKLQMCRLNKICYRYHLVNQYFYLIFKVVKQIHKAGCPLKFKTAQRLYEGEFYSKFTTGKYWTVELKRSYTGLSGSKMDEIWESGKTLQGPTVHLNLDSSRKELGKRRKMWGKTISFNHIRGILDVRFLFFSNSTLKMSSMRKSVVE